MIPLNIEEATARIGKSQGYKTLAIRRGMCDDGATPMLQTAWEPTPAELEALNQGRPVIVTILGVSQPPIKVDVGGLDEDA